MTLTYSLTVNDFLQHQLFSASKNARIKNQRITNWLICSATFLLLGFLFYESGNTLMTWYFLIFGIVFFCFFPLYQKQHYKNHFTKYVVETYKNRFGEITNLTFTDEHIESKDITGESKINLAQIENTTETGNYFYLQIRTGGHLIIPKSGIPDVAMVRHELKIFCKKLNIKFLEELNWKWK